MHNLECRSLGEICGDKEADGTNRSHAPRSTRNHNEFEFLHSSSSASKSSSTNASTSTVVCTRQQPKMFDFTLYTDVTFQPNRYMYAASMLTETHNRRNMLTSTRPAAGNIIMMSSKIKTISWL